jgi:hypothetical protein
MEVKINRMSWDSLRHLRDRIRSDSPFSTKPIKWVRDQFIDALAKAIDMEIRRKEFEGEDLSGSVFVSFDLKFVPEKRLDFGKQTGRKISLKELDELANEWERKGIEEEARLERIAKQIEAGEKNIAGLP